MDEWNRALRCATSAGMLLRAGDPDSCASRAYYAVFHGVTALFLLEGQEFGKHEAVESAVHRDLVRSRRVPHAFGASYTRLRELRMLGDYGVDVHVSAQDAEDALERMRALLEELRGLSKGRLPESA
jgi:uncharacterized protein (UPF0332 family)